MTSAYSATTLASRHSKGLQAQMEEISSQLRREGSMADLNVNADVVTVKGERFIAPCKRVISCARRVCS